MRKFNKGNEQRFTSAKSKWKTLQMLVGLATTGRRLESCAVLSEALNDCKKDSLSEIILKIDK